MLGKTNAAGSGKLFAAIGVTYPEGSMLTCTNWTKALTAKTTTGQWVFAIPEAGTWTVTATDGTSIKSQSVSITAEGQFETVNLSELVLIEEGVEKQTFTADSASISHGVGYVEVGKTSGYDPGDSSYYCVVDLSEFNTLRVKGCNSGTDQDTNALVYVNEVSASLGTKTASVALPESDSPADLALDVSAFTGECRVVLYGNSHLYDSDNGLYRSAVPRVYDMWLE